MTNTPNPYSALIPKHLFDEMSDMLDDLVFTRVEEIKPGFDLDNNWELVENEQMLALSALLHEIAPGVGITIHWANNAGETFIAPEPSLDPSNRS